MNIQASLTPNAATIASLRSNINGARQAVANRQDPGPKFSLGSDNRIMSCTGATLDTLDLGSSAYGWKPETTIKDAVEDLRKSRNKDYKEAACRVGGMALGIGALAGLDSLLAGTALATTTELGGALALIGILGVTLAARPEKAYRAYVSGVQKYSMASNMESWA